MFHGYVQVTTQALHFCASHDVALHWITGSGRYVGGLASSAGVQRRLRQYRALADPGCCLGLARRLCLSRVQAQLAYLLRSTRGSRHAPGISDSILTLRSCLKSIARTRNVGRLRGYEGLAGRAWFHALPALFRPELSDELRVKGRNRRPPRDRFNALLSFGYALLYSNVLQALLVVGLEPSLGFYHTPRSSAFPLALDLMELFRLPIWDIPLIGSLNRMQWDPDADFDVAAGRVWLSPSGRKKAIVLFEERLQEKWRHPVVNYSMSHARLLELESRLLEKEWVGEPGLFACMRLR